MTALDTLEERMTHLEKQAATVQKLLLRVVDKLVELGNMTEVEAQSFKERMAVTR